MDKRIVFLDLEGTLIDVPRIIDSIVPKSMWQILAHMLGEECLEEERQSHKRWLAGEIPTYLDWMDETVQMFVKYGLRKNHIVELNKKVSLTNGISEFAQSMHELGSELAIITGGLKNIAEPVQRLLRARHLFAGCELYFEGEALSSWNLLPSDWYGKVDFMNLIIREYKTNPRNCVFIGDGANDVALAEQVGFSIAFNADLPLQKVATLNISQLGSQRNFAELINPIKEFWQKTI